MLRCIAPYHNIAPEKSKSHQYSNIPKSQKKCDFSHFEDPWGVPICFMMLDPLSIPPSRAAEPLGGGLGAGPSPLRRAPAGEALCLADLAGGALPAPKAKIQWESLVIFIGLV